MNRSDTCSKNNAEGVRKMKGIKFTRA